MFKKSMILVAMLAAAGSVIAAVDMQTVKQALQLKDGSTVYIFKDGKMGMADKQGRTMSMKAGHVMETKDGQRIIMIGNELARIEMIHSVGAGGPSR